jgi:tRNA (guanine37-N1)-methyltransferase
MTIDILTIFPNMFSSPFAESIIKRAVQKELVSINCHDLRDWTTDVHHQVDDRPFGGGAGMVMMVEPIDKALEELKKQTTSSKNQTDSKHYKPKSKTILLSAKGARYTQQKAEILSHLDHLVLVCGHYEGIDQRVYDHLVDEVISIGDYVLTGGELPAMVLVDSIVRLIPGVVGDQDSIVDESHKEPGYIEYPHYTRPAVYKGWSVPDILLSGDHAKIEAWRKENSKKTA